MLKMCSSSSEDEGSEGCLRLKWQGVLERPCQRKQLLESPVPEYRVVSRSKSFLLLAPSLLAYPLISSRFITSPKQISAQCTALSPATFFYLVRLLFPHLPWSCRLLFELLTSRECLETLLLDELNALVESYKQQKKLRMARKALKEANACVSVNYGRSASDPHHGIFFEFIQAM